MATYDFSGQTAVVTGGAQGIGLAIAKRLAKDGATLVIWDLNADKAAAAADELGGSAQACNVADWNSVAAAAEAAGPVDILVNSAGIAGPIASVEDYDVTTWHDIVNINLLGTFHTNRAILPGMKAKGFGRIANVASVAGKEGNPKATAYAASKAGVIGFTKAVAKEVADMDIAVNAIAPAVAQTPILDQMTPEFTQYMLSRIPKGRFVEVDEIAELVAWMVSPDCTFTTGFVFDITGGRATY